MLEDVPGLINPIVQAMIAHANQLKQGRALDIEQQKNEAQQALQKEQLAQAKEIAGYTHEHQVATAAAEQKRAEADALRAKADILLHLNAVNAAGGKGEELLKALIPGLLNTSQNVMQSAPPGANQNFSPAGNYSPVQPAQFAGGAQSLSQPSGSLFATPSSVAEAHGMLARAEAEGKEPAAIREANNKFLNDRALQGERITSEEKIARERLVSEEGRNAANIAAQKENNQLSRGTQMAIAQLQARTHLQSVGMGDDPGSQSRLAALVDGGLTGEIKLNPQNPVEGRAYTVLKDAGGVLGDPKEAQAAKKAQEMLPVLNKMEDIAKQFPTSTAGAVGQNLKTKGANALGITTDLQNQLNELRSNAMTIGTGVDGFTGRPLTTQLKADLDSLITPGITKDQAIDRINYIREKYVNNQVNVATAGMPDWQKEKFFKHNGIIPVAAQSPQTSPEDQTKAAQYEKTAVGPGGHRIGLKAGKWYDIQTGKGIQ